MSEYLTQNLIVGENIFTPEMIYGQEIPIKLGNTIAYISDINDRVRLRTEDNNFSCQASIEDIYGEHFLTFELHNNIPSERERRGFPSEEDFVKFAADIILKRERISGLYDFWVQTGIDYNEYMKLKNQGLPPKNAALNTPFGKNIAQLLNFSEVKEIEEGKDGHGTIPFVIAIFTQSTSE